MVIQHGDHIAASIGALIQSFHRAAQNLSQLVWRCRILDSSRLGRHRIRRRFNTRDQSASDLNTAAHHEARIDDPFEALSHCKVQGAHHQVTSQLSQDAKRTKNISSLRKAAEISRTTIDDHHKTPQTQMPTCFHVQAYHTLRHL